MGDGTSSCRRTIVAGPDEDNTLNDLEVGTMIRDITLIKKIFELTSCQRITRKTKKWKKLMTIFLN